MSHPHDPEQRDPNDSSAWYPSPRPPKSPHPWRAVLVVVALLIIALALFAHAG